MLLERTKRIFFCKFQALKLVVLVLFRKMDAKFKRSKRVTEKMFGKLAEKNCQTMTLIMFGRPVS